MSEIGRLALRVEGKMWNAYYAKVDSVEGAVFLGSIAMKLVQKEDRRNAFMDLMKESVADIIEVLSGERPTYPGAPKKAPEHERNIEHVDNSLAKQLEKSITRNSRLVSALQDVKKDLQQIYEKYGECSIPIVILDKAIKGNEG